MSEQQQPKERKTPEERAAENVAETRITAQKRIARFTNDPRVRTVARKTGEIAEAVVVGGASIALANRISTRGARKAQ